VLQAPELERAAVLARAQARILAQAQAQILPLARAQALPLGLLRRVREQKQEPVQPEPHQPERGLKQRVPLRP